MERRTSIAVVVLLLVTGCGTAGRDLRGSGPLFAAASRAMTDNDLVSAEKFYRRSMDEETATHTEACWHLGMILSSTRRNDAAVDLLRGCDLRNIDVRATLGLVLHRRNQTDEAVRLLEGVVAEQPDRYVVQFVLAEHYEQHRDEARAAAAMEAYLRYRPGDPAVVRHDIDVRRRLARAYADSGQLDNAEAQARILVAQFSPRAEDFAILAELLLKASRCDDAFASLRDAPLHVNGLLASVNVVRCYLKGEQTKKARLAYDQLVRPRILPGPDDVASETHVLYEELKQAEARMQSNPR